MKISVPKLTPSIKKRVYCPYCMYNYQNIVMVYDPKIEAWKCNNCNEIVSKKEDPVEKGGLVAGNEASYNKPYVKTVDINTRQKPKVQDIYNNPLDAWQTDDL